jgi:dihydroflavonol-4-reductase
MIAVTGANGLLGSFIIRKLIDQKEPFIALRRANSDLSLLADVQDLITWREADILDPVSLEEAFEQVTHVIHTAALVTFNPRARRRLYRINVEGTHNVVNASLHKRVKKLIHVSSVAALGRLKGEHYINEDHKWSDDSLNSGYAVSKYLAELEVFRGQEEGLNTVILNPSVILAGADWTKSSAKLFRYVWEEKPFYIENHLNFVDARDVASITHQFLFKDFRGERFILNAGSIELASFFSKIAVRFGKKAPSFKVARPLLNLLAFAENVRSSLTHSEPLITSETARLANTHFNYENKKIKTQINFEFQTIDQTLDWCCQYYINKFHVKK